MKREEQQRRVLLTEIMRPRICLRPVRRNSLEYCELVESIITDDVLQPILLRYVVDSKYLFELVDGWHRFEAAWEAGRTHIPAYIKDMTDAEVMVAQVKCNAIRPKTFSYEYARRLKLLMENGATMAELSIMLDKTPEWIRDQIQLNRLTPQARPLLERGEIAVNAALALANLPADIQPNFVEEVLSTRPADFVKRAKAVRRDYEAYILKERQEDWDVGAQSPQIRAISALRKEAVNSKDAHDVLTVCGATTPLDGWEACMSWVFKLDPVSVEKRKKGRKEKRSGLTNQKYRELNRAMIKKYVNPEPNLGEFDVK